MLYLKFVVRSACCTHLMTQCRTLSSRIHPLCSCIAAALGTCYQYGLPATATQCSRTYVCHFRVYRNFCIIANHCLSSEDRSIQVHLLWKSRKQINIRKQIIITADFRYDSHRHPWEPRQLGRYAGWLVPILNRGKKVSVTTQLFFITAYNVLFNSDRLDLDETCRISWLKAAKFIHG